MKIAIVTGASSGMGREFVLQLTNYVQVDEIWAIARREDALKALQTSVPVRAVPLDLCGNGSFETMRQLLEAEQPDVKLLVNAAGFGKFGAYHKVPMEDDVRKIDLEALPPIDALAFGFPCNDFSVVGEQKGFDGKFGPLYSYGVRVLKSHKPDWFLAENVGGLRSANEGNAFQVIMRDLKEAGYRIYPNLYKFEEYGVPQARHRVIIVGIREDLPYEFKIPSTAPYKDVDVTCKTAIEQPPIPADAFNNEMTLIRNSSIIPLCGRRKGPWASGSVSQGRSPISKR